MVKSTPIIAHKDITFVECNARFKVNMSGKPKPLLWQRVMHVRKCKGKTYDPWEKDQEEAKTAINSAIPDPSGETPLFQPGTATP